MEQYIESKLHAMAKAQEQLARLVAAESRMVLHMAGLAREIPGEAQPFVGGSAEFPRTAKLMTKQLSAYLQTVAELEEALADNLSLAVKELRIAEEE
jgi:hypothetical protein